MLGNMQSTVAFAFLCVILVAHCHAGIIFPPHPMHPFRPFPSHFGPFGPFHGLGGPMSPPVRGYHSGKMGHGFQGFHPFGHPGMGSYQYFNYDQIQNTNFQQGGQGLLDGNWQNSANNWYPGGNWMQQGGSSIDSTAIQTTQSRPGSIVRWNWNEPTFNLPDTIVV